MTDVIKIIAMIQNIIIAITTIYWTYQLLISVAAVIKVKEKDLIINKKHKFMVVMPAHNEQTVIGNLVESLKKVDYPQEYLGFYVIADNSTDKTAEIARAAGAIVFERNQPDKKTKGYALDWFLNQMEEQGKTEEYDAFVVFDADNIVDKDFFNAMNRKLCQGEVLVQGYRDIKNPTDSWVSGGYAIFYWMMNRFYHLARYNVGLSPLINGTAFMVKMELIKETGWRTKTLTEDIEFSLQNIIKGKTLGWAKDAIVYDEQPTTFKASWLQRERWTVGHIQCTQEYTKGLAYAAFKFKTLMNFDSFLYVFGIPIMVITLLLLGVNTIFYFIGEMGLKELLLNYVKYLVPTYIFPMIAAIFTMKLEGKPIKPMLKAVLCYPLFLGSWVLINIKSLIKPNTKWVKIEHTKNVKIDNAEEHILKSKK